MNKKIDILMDIIIFFSSALLTYWLLVDYDIIIASASMIISGILSTIMYNRKKQNVITTIRKNKKLYVFLAVFILYMLYMIRINKGQEILFLDYQLIKNEYIPVVFISAYFYGVIAVDFIANLIKNFVDEMSLWDKKAYIIISGIITTVIILVYCKHSGWYQQYDNVYSIDSGYCFNELYPKFQYYDIRHPLLSLYTFPIYTLISLINHIFVPENMWIIVYAICIQFLNSQLLIIMGLMIKKITDDSKEVFMFFMVSYSVIMYILFLEKYQLCTFMLVAYVYCQCTNKYKETLPLYISSAFTIPTSAFLGISYVFTGISIKEKVKSIFKMIAYAIGAIICLGRGNVLFKGFEEATVMKSNFGGGEWLYSQKLVSLSKLWQGIFLPVNAASDENRYFWVNLTEKYEGIFFLIFILSIIGIITHIRELYIKTSICWLAFSFVLVVIVQWSVSESPLFSLYFAWALIPTVKYGIDYFINKLKLNYKIVYRTFCLLMVVIAFIDLSGIQVFLEKIYG